MLNNVKRRIYSYNLWPDSIHRNSNDLRIFGYCSFLMRLRHNTMFGMDFIGKSYCLYKYLIAFEKFIHYFLLLIQTMNLSNNVRTAEVFVPKKVSSEKYRYCKTL